MIFLRPPDGNGKQKDSFTRQREMWRRAYADAHSLRERFPKVDQIVLDIAFIDPKRLGTYSPQLHSFSASAKAFFAIACPRTLCLEGGFDLDAIVRTVLAGEARTSAGSLECQGWIDPTHPGKTHCLLQMHYRLEVRYGTPKAGAANL